MPIIADTVWYEQSKQKSKERELNSKLVFTDDILYCLSFDMFEAGKNCHGLVSAWYLFTRSSVGT